MKVLPTGRQIGFWLTGGFFMFRVWWMSYFPPIHFLNGTMFPGMDRPYSLAENNVDFNAPYGVLWIFLSKTMDSAFSVFGQARDMNFWTGTLFMDSLICCLLAWHSWKLLFVYLPISTVQWMVAPWNMIIVWLTVMSINRIYLLPLSILAKLPFGGPFEAWKYALRMGSVWQRQTDSYIMYGTLALLWAVVLIYDLFRLKKRKEST